MPELLPALDAFLQEHRRCGELDCRHHFKAEVAGPSVAEIGQKNW